MKNLTIYVLHTPPPKTPSRLEMQFNPLYSLARQIFEQSSRIIRLAGFLNGDRIWYLRMLVFEVIKWPRVAPFYYYHEKAVYGYRIFGDQLLLLFLTMLMLATVVK